MTKQKVLHNLSVYVCVSVALFIQRAMCMHCILPFLACLALNYYSVKYQKWHNFWKNVIEHKTWVLIFTATFVW